MGGEYGWGTIWTEAMSESESYKALKSTLSMQLMRGGQEGHGELRSVQVCNGFDMGGDF